VRQAQWLQFPEPLSRWYVGPIFPYKSVNLTCRSSVPPARQDGQVESRHRRAQGQLRSAQTATRYRLAGRADHSGGDCRSAILQDFYEVGDFQGITRRRFALEAALPVEDGARDGVEEAYYTQAGSLACRKHTAAGGSGITLQPSRFWGLTRLERTMRCIAGLMAMYYD
jgi:hypothetical protein